MLPPGRDRPTTPPSDSERRRQAQYLRRLSRIITAAGPGRAAGLACELRWQEQRPFLPYLVVNDVRVWVVPTSAGRRFLWNRYRSYSVDDAAAAAQAVLADAGYPGA